MKKNVFIVSCITVAALLVLSNLNPTDASSSLPNNGNAGAPMDAGGQTCTSCHAGTATTSTATIITSDIPGTGYVAGTTYNFSVTMSGGAAYGYEITPQTSTSSVGIGTLIAVAGSSVSGKYVKQATKKTGASAVWTFKWKAPATATTVTFYGAFNYANNNNNDQGDVIKKSSVTYFANTTGIEDNTLTTNFVSVFPNPTTDMLNIISSDLFEKGEIYSIDGKLMKTVPEQELLSKSVSVSDLSTGLYFLLVRAKDKNLVTRFSKN